MDYSRKIQCNNSQGGASKVYIFPYISYLSSQITIENNILTDYPYNIIYDMNAVNINYTVDATENIDSEYTEKISFQVKKLKETDYFDKFIQQDYRCIIKDNNNKIRIFGLTNGLKLSYKEDIGTNRTDFNGYSFSLDGKEEIKAPYLSNLDLFNVMPIEGLLIQDGNDNLIQDGNDNIITN